MNRIYSIRLSNEEQRSQSNQFFSALRFENFRKLSAIKTICGYDDHSKIELSQFEEETR